MLDDVDLSKVNEKHYSRVCNMFSHHKVILHGCMSKLTVAKHANHIDGQWNVESLLARYKIKVASEDACLLKCLSKVVCDGKMPYLTSHVCASHT